MTPEDYYQPIIAGAHMPTQLSLYDPDEPPAPDQQPHAPPDGEITLEQLYHQFAEQQGHRERTRAEYATTLRKLRDWSLAAAFAAGKTPNSHRSITPMRVGQLDRANIEQFLAHVFTEAVRKGVGNPERTYNKAREHLRALLHAAADRELIEALPRLPAEKKAREIAGLYWLSDEEIDSLYWATYSLSPPRGWPAGTSYGAYWRAALVAFTIYGLDTQTVLPYERRAEPIRWRHVYLEERLIPDRSSRLESEHGWLWYRRRKTGRTFLLPLTRELAGHLALLPRGEDDAPVWPARVGGSRPCERFRRLCRIAGLRDKIDIESGARSTWQFKDLRKTAATLHEAQIPGASSAVLGHSPADGTAAVTRKHYANTAPLAHRSILAITPPRSFTSVWDESVRPHDLLFAK